MDYLERVRVMHEKGGHGSIGYVLHACIHTLRMRVMVMMTCQLSLRLEHRRSPEEYPAHAHYCCVHAHAVSAGPAEAVHTQALLLDRSSKGFIHLYIRAVPFKSISHVCKLFRPMTGVPQ